MLTFSCNHLLQQGVFRQEVIRLMLLTAVSSLHNSTASNAAAFGTEESTKRRKEQKFKGKNGEAVEKAVYRFGNGGAQCKKRLGNYRKSLGYKNIGVAHRSRTDHNRYCKNGKGKLPEIRPHNYTPYA